MRTKVVIARRFPGQSAAPQSENVPQTGQTLSPGELSRVAEIKQRHRDALMADPAILAVGVGASNDNPEEAAVVLYVDRSAPVPLIPSHMDDARTKVFAIDEFRAFGWNDPQRKLANPRVPQSVDGVYIGRLGLTYAHSARGH